MNNITGKLALAFLSATIILSTACSSGDSAPAAPTNATISEANKQALATAGTEGVIQAVNSDNSNPFGRPTGKTTVQTITELVVQQTQATQNRPQASSRSGEFDMCESGSVTGFDTLGENGGTITYDNCVVSGSTINGTMTINISTAGDIITYSISANLSISHLGTIETINYSSTCTINQSSGAANCTYSSSGTGIDGRSYSVSDIDISGNDSSGYTVSATITDPDNGVITITTTTSVTFNCTNGQPDAGSIVISDGSSSMTITFIDCNSFSIDFNGATTTHSW